MIDQEPPPTIGWDALPLDAFSGMALYLSLLIALILLRMLFTFPLPGRGHGFKKRDLNQPSGAFRQDSASR